MAKAKKADETKILSIRFPEALIKRLDRYVKRFQKQFPGISFQRTDAVRLFVERGLKDPLPADHQPEPPSEKPKPQPKPKKETKARPPAKRKPGAGKTPARKKKR